MALHIVTSRCFLACEKVLSVKIEDFPDVSVPAKKLAKAKKGPKKKAPDDNRTYRISICYYPLTVQASPNYDHGESLLEIELPDKQKAMALYAEIVQEQHPNEGYLDKLVSKMLASDEFQMGEPHV